jgi:hypothetical protein
LAAGAALVLTWINDDATARYARKVMAEWARLVALVDPHRKGHQAPG